MRPATRHAAVAVVLAFTILAAAAFAASPVKVRRCGYAHSKNFGRLAVYPWHMSCGVARRTLTDSESRRDPIIYFTADGADTFDGAAVKIAGKWWVCGGRMGYYFSPMHSPAACRREDESDHLDSGIRVRRARTIWPRSGDSLSF